MISKAITHVYSSIVSDDLSRRADKAVGVFTPRVNSRRRVESDACTVCAVRGVRFSSTPTPLDIAKLYAPCSGYLHDGRRYVVYRVLLYCDDFQPYTSKSGSFGGCYMLPMGIPPSQRSGYGSVRYIGLTPPQVLSNEILQYILQDILKCSTTGVRGVDPWGNTVTIFIDVLGYIGDYPGVTHSLDLFGHNSRAPCHLCSLSAKIESDRLIYLTVDILHPSTAKRHHSAAQLTG
jgi:hypothetical protein